MTKQVCEVMYEDGRYQEMRTKELLIDIMLAIPCVYFQRPYKLEYSMCGHDIYNDGLLRDSHKKMSEDIIAHLKYTGHWSNGVGRIALNQKLQESYEEIYNYLAFSTSIYQDSYDPLDIVEVMRDPLIVKGREEIREGVTGERIRAMYDEVVDMLKSGKYNHNVSVTSFLRGEFKSEQYLQCISYRGYCGRRDGSIYAHPIAESYGTGLNDMHQIVMDSVGYLIALEKSTTDIATSSHGGKLVSMVTTSVENVVRGDCGSTEYDLAYIGPSMKHLKEFVGVNHILPDGSYETITINSTHLLGTEIKARSILTCKLKNPHDVCSTCLGALADNITSSWNLGKFCSDAIVVKEQQGKLSAKHLLKSAVISLIELYGRMSEYFTIDGLSLYLNDEYDKLRVKKSEFIGLHMIRRADILSGRLNLDVTDISQYSSVTSLGILSEEKWERFNFAPQKQNKKTNIVGGRPFSFTAEFIKYVVTAKRIPSGNTYIIDITDFDITKPIGVYTSEQRSDANVIKQMMDILITQSNISPREAVHRSMEIHRTVADTTYAAMCVIAYAYSVANGTLSKLPRGTIDTATMGGKTLASQGTLASAVTYDNPKSALFDPTLITGENARTDRRSHIFDVVMRPQEAIQARYTPIDKFKLTGGRDEDNA